MSTEVLDKKGAASLYEYSNSASTLIDNDGIKVMAIQSFTSASGDKINIGGHIDNIDGYKVSALTEIQDGSLESNTLGAVANFWDWYDYVDALPALAYQNIYSNNLVNTWLYAYAKNADGDEKTYEENMVLAPGMIYHNLAKVSGGEPYIESGII